MEVLRQRIAVRGKGSEQLGTAEQRQHDELKRIGEALISAHGEGAGRQSDDEQRKSVDLLWLSHARIGKGGVRLSNEVQGDGGARLSGA